MRKIPFAGIELTSQRVRGLRGTFELPGATIAIHIIVEYIIFHLKFIYNSLWNPTQNLLFFILGLYIPSRTPLRTYRYSTLFKEKSERA